jgi:hypothetical protein
MAKVDSDQSLYGAICDNNTIRLGGILQDVTDAGCSANLKVRAEAGGVAPARLFCGASLTWGARERFLLKAERPGHREP